MSDNIPLDIQMEIIKCLPVKPLIKFRLVSKSWKSFIQSSQFIKGYGARHTQTHSRILSYRVKSNLPKFNCLIDDDIETFKVQQPELVVSLFLKEYSVYRVVGACHGLLCLECFHYGCGKWMVVIWNPSIGKSFGIALPNSNYDPRIKIQSAYGFGVCPVTSDPTVVKVLCPFKRPWHVEVFTLSSGVWNVIPSAYLPRESIELNWPSAPVVIDRFIYWGACEEIFTHDGESTTINNMVVSFNLITKEFKVVDLPDILTNELLVSVSKLSGSLVVSGYHQAGGAYCCGVWVMEHDLSFRKLFNIGACVSKILGFSKSGKIIFESREGIMLTTLSVYDPSSQQIKNLGISGVERSFFMCSYKESLLLLNHPDLHAHSHDNLSQWHISRCEFTK